jgi:hypothetical protein
MWTLSPVVANIKQIRKRSKRAEFVATPFRFGRESDTPREAGGLMSWAASKME